MAVGICLNNGFPMMIWWGPDLTFIYNDAYAPMLGKRHPDALGRSGRDVWSEIWPQLEEQVQAVMLRGESTWNDRVHLVMHRNGYPEDTWFSWSYSPIPDDHGGIGGLFNTCREETQQVLAERERDRLLERERLESLAQQQRADNRARTILDKITDTALSAGPDLAYIFDRNTRLQYANKALLELWGATLADVIGKNFFELDYPIDLAIKLTADIQQVVKTGKRLMNDTAYTSPTGVSGHFEYIFSPVLGPDGTVEAVAGSTRNVTERKRYEAERERLLLDLAVQRANLAAIIEQAPAFICTLKGPDHVFELANERYYEIVGRREIIGKTVREALPEIEGQGFFELLDNVYRTGETFTGNELPALIRRTGTEPPEWRFMNLVYRAMHEADGTVSGIFVHGVDVTDLVRSREAVIEREGRFRQLADSMPQIVWTARPDGTLDYYNRRWFEYIDVPQGDAASNLAEWQLYVHPDDLGRVGEIWSAALQSGDTYNAEFRVRNKRGDYRWFLVRAQPVRDESGTIVRWYGTCTDIEDRRQKEKQMRDSEERHRAVLAALDEGVSLHDETGAIIMANASAERILGITLDQMRGIDSFDPRWRAVAEDGSALAGEDHPPQVALRTGQPVTNRVMGIHHTDGKLVWVSVNAVPLREPSTGKITGAVSSFFDITLRKQIEEERAELSSRVAHQARVFDATLSAVRDYVFLFDRDGRFLYANKALLDLWGLPAEKAIGHTMRELKYSAEVELKLLGDIRKVFETAQVVTNETAYDSPTGGPGYFEYILAPVMGADRGVETVAGTSRDITERRRAEQERTALLASEQAARAEAERASRMKDEFLATLSHELRTPLNAVLGWSQIMRSSKDPQDLAQGLEVIERNARAQSQIIEDLLDMSRIISGKVRLDVQRLDLSSIVQAAVETARPTADAKGIRLQSVIDPLHGVAISGDANRLQQVLWNLLSNAIKFTSKNGRVQVLLERVNSHFEISVIDTGEGIRADFLPFVFDRFRQADASITRRHGGLGLGLSIVKQLVELHGGSVRVKSAGVGQGATFIVSLPLTILHPEPDSGVERVHPRTPPGSTGARSSCAELTGVKVIVVDDEPDARMLVKRLLEDCHASVTATGSTDEAVVLVKSKKFDVLVSDIGMPDEDGYTLIKRIRALGKENGGDIPAIALTAYARSEDRVKAVAAGFMMHVAKPVEPIELVTMVAGAAGRTGS